MGGTIHDSGPVSGVSGFSSGYGTLSGVTYQGTVTVHGGGVHVALGEIAAAATRTIQFSVTIQ